MIEQKRLTKIDQIKKMGGRITSSIIKEWLIEDPLLGEKLVDENIESQNKINGYLLDGRDIVIQNLKRGKYGSEQLTYLYNNGVIKGSDLYEMYKQDLIKDPSYSEELLLSGKVDSDADITTLLEGCKDEIKKMVRQERYDLNQLKQLVKFHVITEQDLEGFYPSTIIQRIFPKPPLTPPIPPEDYQLPAMEEEYTAVFMFGIPASGKTSLMSGLLYHINSIGKFNHAIKLNNSYGGKYLDVLLSAVKQERLIKATPRDYVQYMDCIIKDQEERQHPISFIEMSGEMFKNIYEDYNNSFSAKLKGFIRSPLRKVITLIVDYEEDVIKQSEDQIGHLRNVLQILAQESEKGKVDVLKTVSAINLVVTKWDKNGSEFNTEMEAKEVEKFIKKGGYMAVYNMCAELADMYENLNFTLTTYSLGTFEPNGITYTFDGRYSDRLYQYLCAQSHYKVEDKRKKKSRKSIFKRK